jgi:hypothetical protein
MAQNELPEDEVALLQGILIYPISEKIINGFRCLREHGVMYTVKRIFLGRQSR